MKWECVAKVQLVHPRTKEVLAREGQVVTPEMYKRIMDANGCFIDWQHQLRNRYVND